MKPLFAPSAKEQLGRTWREVPVSALIGSGAAGAVNVAHGEYHFGAPNPAVQAHEYAHIVHARALAANDPDFDNLDAYSRLTGQLTNRYGPHATQFAFDAIVDNQLPDWACEALSAMNKEPDDMPIPWRLISRFRCHPRNHRAIAKEINKIAPMPSHVKEAISEMANLAGAGWTDPGAIRKLAYLFSVFLEHKSPPIPSESKPSPGKGIAHVETLAECKVVDLREILPVKSYIEETSRFPGALADPSQLIHPHIFDYRRAFTDYDYDSRESGTLAIDISGSMKAYIRSSIDSVLTHNPASTVLLYGQDREYARNIFIIARDGIGVASSEALYEWLRENSAISGNAVDVAICDYMAANNTPLPRWNLTDGGYCDQDQQSTAYNLAVYAAQRRASATVIEPESDTSEYPWERGESR